MTLIYKEPPGCCKHKAGAILAICERTGEVASYSWVKRSGVKWMVMDDGRRFRNGTGWFVGSEQDWPFPYVRGLNYQETANRETIAKSIP